jgi:hypothetical protein
MKNNWKNLLGISLLILSTNSYAASALKEVGILRSATRTLTAPVLLRARAAMPLIGRMDYSSLLTIPSTALTISTVTPEDVSYAMAAVTENPTSGAIEKAIYVVQRNCLNELKDIDFSLSEIGKKLVIQMASIGGDFPEYGFKELTDQWYGRIDFLKSVGISVESTPIKNFDLLLEGVFKNLKSSQMA